MNLKYRRLIYLSFFLIFFILAPALIIYTGGYRYNFKKNQLEKTGIIYIDSLPKKADVYLNGQHRGITPARVTQVLPDKYNLIISYDGYHPWLKDIEVKSGLTTFIKDVILFKKNLPVLKFAGQVNLFALNQSQEKIIYSLIKNDVEELHLANLKTDLGSILAQFDTKLNSPLIMGQWSPQQQKILLKQPVGNFNKYLIVDLENHKIQELLAITKLNFSQLVWNNKNDYYLYGQRGNTIYQIDLMTKAVRPILNSPVTDFQVKGDNIYYLTRINAEYFLNRRPINNENLAEKIKLPSASYVLADGPEGLIILLDKKNNDLFVLRQDAFGSSDIAQEIILQAKAKDIIWSADNKKMAYYNDFEIWVYDLISQTNELVNRYGKIINAVDWQPQNNYLVYQMENAVKIVELRLGNIRNDVTLTKLPEIKTLAIDGEGKNIYLVGKLGDQTGIFQLTIQ